MNQFVRVTDEVRRLKSKAGEPFEMQVCRLCSSDGLAESFDRFVGRDGPLPPGDYVPTRWRLELENQGRYGRRPRPSFDLEPMKSAAKAV